MNKQVLFSLHQIPPDPIQLQKKKSGVKKKMEICAIKGGVQLPMANAILNFHFFWNTSLKMLDLTLKPNALTLSQRVKETCTDSNANMMGSFYILNEVYGFVYVKQQFEKNLAQPVFEMLVLLVVFEFLQQKISTLSFISQALDKHCQRQIANIVTNCIAVQMHIATLVVYLQFSSGINLLFMIVNN